MEASKMRCIATPERDVEAFDPIATSGPSPRHRHAGHAEPQNVALFDLNRIWESGHV